MGTANAARRRPGRPEKIEPPDIGMEAQCMIAGDRTVCRLIQINDAKDDALYAATLRALRRMAADGVRHPALEQALRAQERAIAIDQRDTPWLDDLIGDQADHVSRLREMNQAWEQHLNGARG